MHHSHTQPSSHVDTEEEIAILIVRPLIDSPRYLSLTPNSAQVHHKRIFYKQV
jgi:hypothetical protein